MVADSEKELVCVNGSCFHKFVFAEPEDDW